jgi:hypothetical protein
MAHPLLSLQCYRIANAMQNGEIWLATDASAHFPPKCPFLLRWHRQCFDLDVRVLKARKNHKQINLMQIKSLEIKQLNGNETDEELRALILKSTLQHRGCSCRKNCMIRSFAGLSFATLQNLVSDFSREFCLQILGTRCNGSQASVRPGIFSL